MKPRFSLRLKILAWFFVNLAVIGAGLVFFLRAQFQVGIDSLLAGPTGHRLEAIAQPLAAEMRRVPEGEWGAALERATAPWRARGVRAALLRNDGRRFAGDVPDLPPEIRQVIENYDRRKRGPMGGRRPPPRRGPDRGDGPPSNFADREDRPPPPRPARPFERDGPPPFGPRERTEIEAREGQASAPSASGATLQKFMVVTHNPRVYWAGVHLDGTPVTVKEAPPLPLTLVLASDSLRGGGLFFDYLPWLGLGGGLLLCSTLVWLPFVHRLTRDLGGLTANAESIAQGRFEPPAESRRTDEIGRLSRAHREMAVRLDGFVAGQKRFLGDTAHELLSPLARLEVALSILEQRAASDDLAYTERALTEVRHISALVHDLLSFTKAGLRIPPAEMQTVPLAGLARQVVAREAPEANLNIEIDEEVRVVAQPELLGRALANVVRNALRYAGEAGPIHLSAEVRNGSVRMLISDQGPGVPPESLSQLFDPFFRPDIARTRETGGTGLGLAIVKSGIEACGGRVAVRNLEPHGLELEFILERAS